MDLTPRMLVALRKLADETDPGPEPSQANGWRTPRRTTYAFIVADAIDAANVDDRRRRGYGTRSATGAANTLLALRRRGLVAGGTGMVFETASWWITNEGVAALAAAES